MTDQRTIMIMTQELASAWPEGWGKPSRQQSPDWPDATVNRDNRWGSVIWTRGRWVWCHGRTEPHTLDGGDVAPNAEAAVVAVRNALGIE
jgi:hypothetical protein